MSTRIVDTEGRLDKWLASWDSVGSRRRARQAIETGKVLVDGEVVQEPAFVVEPGVRVELQWNRPGTAQARHKSQQELRAAGVRIVYEDAAMIAVNKPAGLLTDTASVEQHRSRDSVYKRLRAYLRPFGDRPRTVHRIDRDTSGVVLFARTDAAERHLRDQFRKHTTERLYLAVVHGLPDFEHATWEDWTRWNKSARLLVQVPEEAEGSRRTACHVRVLRRLPPHAAELEIRLDTGRRNQIRLQAALRGHPLLGERLYGEPPRTPTAPRQLLHASRLTVLHPDTGEPVGLKAPLPADYKTVTRYLRGQDPSRRG